MPEKLQPGTREQAVAYRAQCAAHVGEPSTYDSIGVIMAEADWEAELFFIAQEEADLP